MNKREFKKLYGEARAALRGAAVVVGRGIDLCGRPRFNVIKSNFLPVPDFWRQEMYQVIGAKHAPALPALTERLADYRADYPYDYT